MPANLQQPAPFRQVAGQPRHLAADHDSDLPEADLGHQGHEARPGPGLTGGNAEIVVNHRGADGSPAELARPPGQAVLQRGRFAVAFNLSGGRLADVDNRLATDMAAAHPAGGAGAAQFRCHRRDPVADADAPE